MIFGSTGRVPGGLCALGGTGFVIFAQAKGAAKLIARQAGKRFVALALKKAGSRLAGKLFLNSKAWVKAFEHVAEHFSVKALASKASHSVFTTAFRSKPAVEKLIRQALKGPTKKYISRLTIGGDAIGRPCVVIEKEFAEVIGETFKKVGAEIVKQEGGDCKWLRIVVDITGRPITAFPFKP